MALVAFGRKTLDPERPTHGEVLLVIRDLPRRFRSCSLDVSMRGTSELYEDWVAIRVTAEQPEVADGCVEWLSRQLTSRSIVIVPLEHIGS